MFSAGLTLFALYAFLNMFDEILFHRSRRLRGVEKAWRLVNSLLIVASITLAIFIRESDLARLSFYAAVCLSLICFPLSEWDKAAFVTNRERALHCVLSMVHPIMLVLLFVVGKFIDGAGFFLGLVLPFSVNNLRPLCYGYLGVMALFLIIQLIPSRKPATADLEKTQKIDTTGDKPLAA